jgi:glycine/D-amino acid oxidase-like deaminating enzyme
MPRPPGRPDPEPRQEVTEHAAATTSVWRRSERPPYERFVGDRRVEVAVIGGGITGLTTAALLCRGGMSVTLLEARRIGDGTSGRSTAKVTALQGSRLRSISDHHGADAARTYATDQLEALDWIAAQVESAGVECAWERRASVSYATTERGARTVAEEATAAVAAGLPVTTAGDVDLPFPVTAAARLDDQAQFDPVPYLEALAAEVDASSVGAVHEWSRASRITGRGPYRIGTADGSLVADHVVVATLLPITDRGLFFARAKPVTSYTAAVEVDAPLPEDMSISVDEPTRSLRTTVVDDRRLLLVGGEGSGVARGPMPSEAVRRLVEWADRHFGVREVVSTWSAHDYAPADHLPWVGPCSPLGTGVLVATGFEKWGITMGTAAAHRLAHHLMCGLADPWSPYNPARLSIRSLPSAAKLNLDVATRLAGDWIDPAAPADDEGRGRRFRSGLLPKGDPDGRSDTAPVKVVCTHLGGVCRWNDLERTWDCPLHGSRFEAEGTVVAAPAVRDL